MGCMKLVYLFLFVFGASLYELKCLISQEEKTVELHDSVELPHPDLFGKGDVDIKCFLCFFCLLDAISFVSECEGVVESISEFNAQYPYIVFCVFEDFSDGFEILLRLFVDSVTRFLYLGSRIYWDTTP